MQTMWFAANYLAEIVRSRTHILFKDNKETGALSLEWVIIAVVLFLAATAAGVVFSNAVTSETAKLP
jgi:hypothetical protein